ncbi:MAG TPA: S41 family peptidase [Candidatus Eremiobacteraceae bacterium]|nr:S41 family peptidase [Candidatus Eremiobacteraceae bacterium]
MPAYRRAIAVVLAIVAAAGLTLAYERAHLKRTNALDPRVLAFHVGDARGDFSVGGQLASADDRGKDLSILDISMEKVHEHFYKPIDDQGLLKGERTGLVKFLEQKHVNAVIALPTADNVLADDTAAANKMLTDAMDSYSSAASVDDMTFAAVSGMLDSLNDPYTVFLSPREIQSLNELIRGGDFGGIGIYIGKDPKTKDIEVLNPIEGTPASHAGLKPFDTIISVDGHLTKPMDLDSVMNLIRGKVGTAVKLLVARKGAPDKTYVVVREQIHVPSVSYRMIGKDVGYIQLYDFGDTSEQEVTAALNAVFKQGAKAIVFDLRNNGGGLLDAAVQVSSKFIADGPIVSTIDRAGQVETEDAYQDAVPPHPLVVLVNQYTASASEITAGAIQDARVGVLLGVRTYGKGVVQTIYDLPGSSAVKITTARYVTPNGRDINKRGIDPNITVPMDPKIVGLDSKDVQLKAALEYVHKQIALSAKNP